MAKISKDKIRYAKYPVLEIIGPMNQEDSEVINLLWLCNGENWHLLIEDYEGFLAQANELGRPE